MNTRLICTLGMALLAAISLNAQGLLKVDVPFDFQAGGALLPAGSYTVDLARLHGFVVMASREAKAAAVIPSWPKETVKTNSEAKLIFLRYGDNYFLSQVWPAGSVGREIPKSKREKELAIAAARPAQQTLVAAK